MAIVKFAGFRQHFPDGRCLVLAPLTARALRQVLDASKALKGPGDPDNVTMIVGAVHSSLQRNYPSITVEDVECNLLDADNMSDLLKLIMQSSGAQKTHQDDPAEDPTEGEDQGAPSSTGTP